MLGIKPMVSLFGDHPVYFIVCRRFAASRLGIKPSQVGNYHRCWL